MTTVVTSTQSSAGGNWPSEDAVNAFTSGIRGQVFRPGDSGYSDAIHVYNGMVQRTPAVVVRVSGVADVIATVNFAREHGILTSVKAGGHNIAGNALADGGIVIDLANMKGVYVDPVTRRARVQGGATWGDFDRETAVHGLATTGGLISSTGVSGLTLGGGFGWLMRKHGMAVDNLVSVEMVTAQGEVITASEREHPDLFWAMRGAGHNFGVVTSMEFKVHPMSTLVAGMVVYPYDRAREVLRNYAAVTANAPREVIAFAAIMHSPEGDRILAIIGAYTGPESEAEAALAPLRQFGEPVADTFAPIAYPELQGMLDGGFPFGLQNYWKSSFVGEITDGAIDALLAEYDKVTSPLNVAMFEHFGGAVSDVAPGATAFPHRNAKYNFAVVSRWEDPAVSERHIRWARDACKAMQPISIGGTYVNYLGADEADRIGEAYGEIHARLIEVKKRYDPANFFRVNQNIKPSA
jgi:FAD/FMN-containing dehydrogenase